MKNKVLEERKSRGCMKDKELENVRLKKKLLNEKSLTKEIKKNNATLKSSLKKKKIR